MRVFSIALLLLTACPATPPAGEGVACPDNANSLYGLSDPNCATLVDEDRDGFPITNTVFACCCNSCSTDCNDGDADVRPVDDNGDGPDDPAGDGVDQDCNGVDGPL